ncbi:colicin immunity domain-containing protein [Duganella sp. CT11-25]|uniref:colicin immunity domain-containing protein n=1 Tax=unclassified Duganella TaxID=2636909 RepID=UPI0039AF2FE5
MNKVFEMYVDLIEAFLDHRVSLQEFSATFMERFLNETEQLDEPLFLLLDELFGDVDSFTDDPELLAENPGFYLDHQGLEAKARDVLRRMQVWRAHRRTA